MDEEIKQRQVEIETMLNSFMILTDFLEGNEQVLARQLIFHTLLSWLGEVGADLTPAEQAEAEDLYLREVLKEKPINEKEIH